MRRNGAMASGMNCDSMRAKGTMATRREPWPSQRAKATKQLLGPSVVVVILVTASRGRVRADCWHAR
jgi:hypothetical protein